MREIVAPENNKPVLPPPLHPGDTIGLFCPAGPVRNMEYVKKGIEYLHDFGFQVKIVDNLQEETDPGVYLAGPDNERVRRLRDLWLDDEVKALMAVRGGYGCLRILDLLDFQLFHDSPKLLIGFSDVTTLLAAIFGQAGVIGLHGPVVSTLSKIDQRSRGRLFDLMAGEYLSCPGSNDVEIIRYGTGTGRLIVGNLTTLIHLIGTPYEPVFDKAILVIEDTGESLYRIDRMLTHLSCSGKLQRLAGLILGTFDLDKDAQKHLNRRILELTTDLEYSIWGNFLGHGRKNITLPYGMPATMGADKHLRLHVDQVQCSAGLPS